MKIASRMLLSIALALLAVSAMAQSTRNKGWENGSDTTRSQREAQEDRQSRSASRTLNINNQLLDAYAALFEKEAVAHPDPLVQLYLKGAFGTAVVSGPNFGFPINIVGDVPMPAFVVADTMQKCRMQRHCLHYSTMLVKEHEPFTAAYLRSVAFAHYVLLAAADDLQQRGVHTDSATAARDALMGVDLKLAAQDAERLYRKASCTGNYPAINTENGEVIGRMVLHCGVINFDAESREAMVEGRKTLSAEAIDGRRTEVALTDDSSNSQSREKSSSQYRKDQSGGNKTWQTAR